AVAALTSVLALTEYQKQSMIESSDRYQGRVAMLNASLMPTTETPVDWVTQDQRLRESTGRFDFAYTSRIVEAGAITIPVQTSDMVRPVSVRLMDPAYAVMHRITLAEGRWFTPADEHLLAPPVVITAALWESLGSITLTEHPVLQVTGDAGGRFPIIGVTPKQGVWDTDKQATMLVDGYLDRMNSLPKEAQMSWEFWVPQDRVAEIAPVLAMDLRAGLPAGFDLSLSRTDWGTQPEMMRQFDMIGLITGAIAGLILLLGGLGLLNVQLVAMRQRIREIGVRRSFGASGARVFTAVMLESVVATTVAGFAGIMLAVAAMRTLIGLGYMFPELQDLPSFPLGAALGGLAATVAVGALAGLIPALVALRVKVIDAIRF
ncbi:MAG: ABC transporter permease, partial [Actinobacteria bacterium]|nr:ABC transporter permease [Actinomycetota bacterium]